jgi:hypothetical protein
MTRPHHVSFSARRLCAALTLAAVVACGRTDTKPAVRDTAALTSALAPARVPRLYVVGVDISGSRTPTQLAEGQQLLASIVDSLDFGDRIVLVETYRARNDSAIQWVGEVAARRRLDRLSTGDRRGRATMRRVARETARTFFDTTRSKQLTSTDLLFTISRAADYAKAAEGRRTTLLLLSDMLNSTPDLNMERRGGVPDARWIAERKAKGLVPELSGVCVEVVGADVTTERGAAVREFWTRYFAAAGATMPSENYRNLVTSAREIGCS